MPREFARHQRLATEVQRSLSEVLRFETRDPRLQRLSLTTVDLSKDLSVARIYYAMLDPNEDPAPAAEGLLKASGFLRSQLGRALSIRHIPELRFVHDDSAARGARISELIDDALHADDRS